MANEAERADARRGVRVPEARAETVVHLLPVASAPERPRRRQPHLLVPVIPVESICLGFGKVRTVHLPVPPLPVPLSVLQAILVSSDERSASAPHNVDEFAHDVAAEQTAQRRQRLGDRSARLVAHAVQLLGQQSCTK